MCVCVYALRFCMYVYTTRVGELVYKRSPKLQTTEKREAPPVTRPLPLKMPRLLLTMSLRRAGSHPRAFDEI